MTPRMKKYLWGAWAVLAVLGIAGLLERMIFGHTLAGYGSYVIWGLGVSAYIYFSGLSAGAFLLAALIYVFGVRPLERIGRLSLVVAIITLFMALLSIWFDLGRMGRFYRVFTQPNFSSMMAWMVWLYTAYWLLLLGETWLAMRPEFARGQSRLARLLAFHDGPLSELEQESGRRWLRWLAAVGVPLAVAFSGGVGALFGTVSARTHWHTPLMPVLFLTGALLSGGGLIAFAVAAFWTQRDEGYRETVSYLGRLLLILLAFDLMLEWAEFSIPMWYGFGPEFELLKRVLFGEFWWVFWIVHLGLGSLLPAALLLTRRRDPRAVGLAGLLIAVTFLTVRLNIVIPGLIEPNLQGLESAFVHPRLSFEYTPSFFEWQLTALVVALGIAAFYLAYRYLPLTEERTP